MSLVTLQGEFTVFNAPSHTYIPMIKRAAERRGCTCEIISLRNGVFRSRYFIRVRGEELEVRQFLAQI